MLKGSYSTQLLGPLPSCPLPLLPLRPQAAEQHPPDSATSEMGTPCSWDMKPRMEKTTNPATKLVALFRKQRAMLSLQKMGRKREKETHHVGTSKDSGKEERGKEVGGRSPRPGTRR